MTVPVGVFWTVRGSVDLAWGLRFHPRIDEQPWKPKVGNWICSMKKIPRK